MRLVRLLIVTSLFCAVAPEATLLAQTTGKIAGVVIDQETGEPLPGANVIVTAVWQNGEEIEDGTRGTATDADGQYYILNLKPGSYTITASFIGFGRSAKQKVPVDAGKTTELDFELAPETVMGGEVQVTAYRQDKIDPDRTSTMTMYNVDDVASMPGINSVADILDLQADVVDGHFRGGRDGEASFEIGGVSIVNPLSNQRSFTPIIEALQQVQVTTSGFSAEHGNAMSGVVNMVPQQGGRKWRAQLTTQMTLPQYKHWGGSYYSADNMMWYDLLKDPAEWLKEDPSNPGNFLWQNIIGNYALPEEPTFADSMRLAEVARANFLQTVEHVGMEYAEPDYRFVVTAGGPITRQFRVFVAARLQQQAELLPTIPSQERQVLGNVSFHPRNSSDEVVLSYRYNFGHGSLLGRGAHSVEAFDLGKRPLRFQTKTQQVALSWNHMFSKSTVLDLKLNAMDVLDRTRHQLAGRNEVINDAFNPDLLGATPTPVEQRVLNRPNANRGDQRSASFGLDAKITSQITDNQMLMGGVQLQLHDLDVEMETSANSVADITATHFEGRPYEGAIYIEDKMEYEGAVANVGLRADFYDFNTTYFADEFTPFRNPDFNPDAPYYEQGKPLDPERALKEETSAFAMLQPRLGISFPITEGTVIHLNYGKFLARPPFSRVFFSEMGPDDTISQLGNPNLRPERTTSYDIGIVQMLPGGFYLDVSGYYKDVRDLVQSVIYQNASQNYYYTFANRDYANIQGFHINLEKAGERLRGYLRYNWQVVKGKTSTPFTSPTTFYENPPAGVDPVDHPDPQDILLDFDRTHRLIANAQVSTSPEAGFQLLGGRPFSDVTVSTTYRLQSGRPYSYSRTGAVNINNQRTPFEHDMRLRIQKDISVGEVRFRVFGQVYNLLNQKELVYGRIFNQTDETKRFVEDRENLHIFQEEDTGPYVFDRSIEIYSNQPRSYEVGLIANF